jgi:hypothetical protein
MGRAVEFDYELLRFEVEIGQDEAITIQEDCFTLVQDPHAIEHLGERHLGSRSITQPVLTAYVGAHHDLVVGEPAPIDLC